MNSRFVGAVSPFPIKRAGIHALRVAGLVCVIAVSIMQGVSAQTTPETLPIRLVVIKVDGMAPDQLAAVANPENQELMKRLPYGEALKKAIVDYRRQTGRQIILPNIRRTFFEDGVVFDNMFSHTLTLSAVAWSVIETGQPTVVKGHGILSRDTCYMRSHLDGLRDMINYLMVRPGYNLGRTSATWVLDQVGVSLTADAFDPFRTWTAPQIYQRHANREFLLEGGRIWLKGGAEKKGDIVRSHLSRRVTGIDYTEFNQELAASFTGVKVLEKDLTGRERFDYLSPLMTLMDHQQHVDPHPINLIHWLVKLDDGVGDILRAVSRSERRDRTVVAVVSDHGSEIKPGVVGYSFPITRVFRERRYGGHTVKTLLVEDAFSAVSVPIPGLDRPRIYESRYSPYNKKGNPRHGEDGWVTAFIDPFGNARAAVHLRNDDLNRLHLLLLELKNKPKGQRLNKIRTLFEQTLERTRRWLAPDLALYRDYLLGAADLAAGLERRADRATEDTLRRLKGEVQRDTRQVHTLERLLSLSFKPGQGGLPFEQAFAGDFAVTDFVPKQYMGLANGVRQLSRYTVGLDGDLNWVSSTLDHKGRRRPLDYFQLLDDHVADNPPRADLANPYDFMVVRLSDRPIRDALLKEGLLQPEDRIKNVIWLRSTAENRPRKGGQALIIETIDRRVAYVPIQGLKQGEDFEYSFVRSGDIDPLALLKGEGFSVPGGEDSLGWMARLRPWREWLPATYRTEYGTAPTILLDILNDAVPQFVDNPEFQKYLVDFSTPELKQRYLRGLKRKYASRTPDFLVWADELWNFNSKARTAGGNHSGLRPMVSKIACLIWGGDGTGIARGRLIRDVYTSLDFTPTLLRAAGMLDDDNRVIRAPNAMPERTFAPLPGVVVDIWRVAPPPPLEFPND